MSIDWFTLIAQVLNFLVLLWLMKRFLYKPILKAIDQREKRIASELASAQSDKISALKQKEENDQTSKDLATESKAMLTKAQDEAHKEKEKLLKEARVAAETRKKDQQEALLLEEKTLRTEVKKTIQNEVLAITTKVLKDLATVTLQEQVVESFLSRLKDLDANQKKDLKSEIQGRSEPIVLRTAEEMGPELKKKTDSVIQGLFGSSLTLVYESSADLICGIEVCFPGQKIAWTIQDYLSTLSEKLINLIHEEDQ